MRLLILLLLFWAQISYADIIPTCCDCTSSFDSLKIELNKLSVLIKKQPGNSDTFLKRGKIFECLNKMDSAYLDIRQSIKLNSKNAEALLNLGSLFYNELSEITSTPQQLAIDSALYFATKAIDFNPEYAEAYHFRGNIHIKKKDYAAAIADFNEAIKFKVCCNPSTPYFGRCFSYLLTGQLDSAYFNYNIKYLETDERDMFDENVKRFFTDNPKDALIFYQYLLDFKDGLYSKKNMVWCFGYFLSSLYEKEPERKKILGDIWH
jgi:tetratricopeptide (TPR) repeat protein